MPPSDLVHEPFGLFVASVRDYAMFMLDTTGRVATWNLGAQRIKGYQAEEIIGSHFSRFYPPEDIAAGKCEMELEVAAREGRFEDEGWRVRKDGTQLWANVVITAVRDEHGTLVGFGKVTRDLTERKRSEEERSARLAAEQMNRVKDEFLAILGHELRNPLAPIVTALQLIEMRGESASSRELAVIDRHVKHMMRLVDDLLDVSRVESGKVELRKQHFDVRESVAKAIEATTPQIERGQHRLILDLPKKPVIVDGDEARLCQVFSNLLNNAAKYTEPGGRIRFALTRDGERATVQVSDNGIGIDAALLPRVFELFVQGAQNPERSRGGLGLGLNLAASLVRMHDGTIAAASEGPGRGSVFTVSLPIVTGDSTTQEMAVADPTSPIALGRKKILLVDDNEDACLLLADVLAARGHEVQTAFEGAGALALAAELHPDLAILDLGLPGMDGYELAAAMRAALPATKLIALSGYGSESDRARSQAAGFDRHLVKPVAVQALLKLLAELG